MIRLISILVILVCVYYFFKIVWRMLLNNFSRKMNANSSFKEQQKPRHNLDKSKAIDARFEELK